MKRSMIKMISIYSLQRILIAAFGPYIEPVLKYSEIRGNIMITAPESFEFVLLHLDSITKYLSKDLGEIDRTYDFCDSKVSTQS